MQVETSERIVDQEAARVSSRVRVFDLLLIVVLLAGAFFRFSGLEWDEYTWMHPDERFLIWVTSDLHPVDSLGAYFDTTTSTLNPNNVGHGFYVYGTFPIILTRYLVSWLGGGGWEEVAQVGRTLSAVFDLLSVLLVYLIAARAFNRRVAILAAAFLGAAVLPIQLAHFYKEDTFLNFFTLLAIYFAVRISTNGRKTPGETAYGDELPSPGGLLINWRQEWPLFLGFGLALGLATASKLNAAPVAFLLPLAVLVRFFNGSREEQARSLYSAILLVVLSAGVSLVVFRIAQPYAFEGPGFLNVQLNESWLAQIREQRNQAAGDIDFPPSLQWARRPVWFGGQNIILWGLGLPLGIVAWLGVLWAGWRILKGEWRQHLVLWTWVVAYFVWQSLQFNPTMRYFLPIYPVLVIYAGWLIDRLISYRQKTQSGTDSETNRRAWVVRVAAGVLALFVLAGTYIYAAAFNRVHTEPFTRAEASRWIFDNIPGPINLAVQTDTGQSNQIIPVPYDYQLNPGVPFYTSFMPRYSGTVDEVRFHNVVDRYSSAEEVSLLMRVQPDAGSLEPLLLGNGLGAIPEPGGELEVVFALDRQQLLTPEQTYFLLIEPAPGQQIFAFEGQVILEFAADGEIIEQAINTGQQLLESPLPFEIEFTPPTAGILQDVRLKGSLQSTAETASGTLTILFAEDPEGQRPLAGGSVQGDFSDPAGYTVVLDRPLMLQENEVVYVVLTLDAPAGTSVYLRGEAVANEGDWDDGLPLRMEGYDPFGGVYVRDLNFNMYWDDNPEKRARFKRILDETEYIFISSSRQWANLPRLPERFPMTTAYYRSLLGCPPENAIEWCYNVAEPGMFTGELGFELVQIFQSNPQIGPISINDQFAEEAFTVYDHPKVFIFKKTSSYSPERVAAVLESVDLSRVIRVTPKRAASHPMDLMLPAARLAVQRAGGTWQALFDSGGPLNQYPGLAAVVWYGFIFLLGLVVYPIVRIALPGLADRGYPVSRIAGLLLFAWLAWMAGSFTIRVTQLTLAVMFALVVGGGLLAAFVQRQDLRRELRERRNYFLIVEALALLAFTLFLLVRLGNPDLWHPWKGGEKPMDFAYLNAVIKSSTFPPYDPWYAGGYINYYYYGFVVVGMPVKLLGIEPSIAYNLILPTLLSLILLGAFTLGYNLLNPPGRRYHYEPEDRPFLQSLTYDLQYDRGLMIGSVVMLLVGVLGNLGMLRMILRGYQMIGAPGTIEGAGLLNRIRWGLSGFSRALTGAEMPYGLGDWYWIPSRVIAAQGDVEPINEFPYFTTLYADLHAHLVALPITLLVLAWGLSTIQARGTWGNLRRTIAGFFLGALAIGALRPTNTWDFPTYLVLGVAAVIYGMVLNPGLAEQEPWRRVPHEVRRWVAPLVSALLLVALALLLYQPFANWYGQGYSEIDFWQGSRTPLYDYLTHWGIFIFLIFSWMAHETLDWMAKTPVSALRRLQPYQTMIWLAVVGLALLVVLLGVNLPGVSIPLNLPLADGVRVAWLALPMAFWAAVLLFRPGQSVEKRAVLFLIGSGFVLSLAVEVIVLVGDIGRMNTVFKFYYQSWVLFAVSAGAGVGWTLEALPTWKPVWRNIWRTAVVILLVAGALYPLLATTAKIKDRMAPEAPHTLDGQIYMQYATYPDQGVNLQLQEDYQVIRWMLENVPGSPVIMEGNTPEYRWGSRYSINTGLPAVVGWNWHQRQQRGSVVSADWVTERIGEVSLFYTAPDAETALHLLDKYNVKYFIVGQLEKAYYPGPGLDKFAAQAGRLWEVVFQTGDTLIYRVFEQAERPADLLGSH